MGAMSSAGDGPRAVGSSPSATNATSAGPSKSPKQASFGFPKSARLLKRGEFRRVYDQGSRVTSSSFAMFFAVRSADHPATGPRIGFTTPRAVGKAVIRNRLRRRLREAVRLELPQFTAPVDYVFHPRRSGLEAPLPQLRREVERIFRKCEAAPR